MIRILALVFLLGSCNFAEDGRDGRDGIDGAPAPTPTPTPEPLEKPLRCEAIFRYGENRTHTVYFEASQMNSTQKLVSVRSVYEILGAKTEEATVAVIEDTQAQELESDLFKVTFSQKSARTLNLSTNEEKEMSCKD
jgi:hypothetical protein